MAKRIYSNTAVVTTLSAAVNSSVTTIPVVSTTGFASPGAGEEAVAALDFGDASLIEIITYTGKTGTSLTGATRGQDGTAAQSHLITAPVWHAGSAKDFENAARINKDNKFVESTVQSFGRIVVTEPWLDVRARGAVLNGVADDTQALNDACAEVAALTPLGGVVLIPHGIAGVTDTIEVPNRVTLRGVGRESSTIKALGAFPVDTPLVQLGIGAGIAFHTRLEHLAVDCNSIATSTAIYSERINEQSGVFDVLAVNFKRHGIHIKAPASGNPAENYEIDDVELTMALTPAAGAVGLYIDNPSISVPVRGLRNITFNSYDNATTLTRTAMSLNGVEACVVEGVHVEHVTTGVHIGPTTASSALTLIGINGAASVTDLIRIGVNCAGNPMTLLGIVKNGGTNILVDEVKGLTLTSHALGLYVLGIGAAAASMVLSDDPAVDSLFPDVLLGNGDIHARAAAATRMYIGSVAGDAGIVFGSSFDSEIHRAAAAQLVSNSTFRPRASTTGNRPASPPEGSIYYDTTITLPIYFDGSNWKKFDGTAA